MMPLLANFTAPQTTKLVWHSLADYEKWSPRLRQINKEWAHTERLSVLEGVRPAALQPLNKSEYLSMLPWAMSNGIKVRVVRTAAEFQGFSHHYEEGDDMLVTALARSESDLAEPEAHLGYPLCCQAFFAAHFPAGIADPIWQWAGERSAVSAPPYANPMLRYWNIRFAPHLPCSTDCPESVHLGGQMAAMMSPDVRAWCIELLGGPVTWDCYRGIAIVTAKPFRLVVGSVPTAKRYVVASNTGGARAACS